MPERNSIASEVLATPPSFVLGFGADDAGCSGGDSGVGAEMIILPESTCVTEQTGRWIARFVI